MKSIIENFQMIITLIIFSSFIPAYKKNYQSIKNGSSVCINIVQIFLKTIVIILLISRLV